MTPDHCEKPPPRTKPDKPQARDTKLLPAPKTILALDADEAQKLAAFITGKAHIERYPVTTPAKARFEQLDD